MQVSYTALELYEYIRSFDLVRFWGNNNEENVIMVAVKTSDLRFVRGKKLCHIEVNVFLDSCFLGCCIAGNVFFCKKEEVGNFVKLTIESDYNKEVSVVTLEKIF